MDAQRWQAVEDLFLQASELNGEDRRKLLDAACAEDPELRREVDELLEADSDIEAPLAQAIGATLQEAGPLFPNLHIDRYEIESELGRGGMGTVFLGRRADRQYQMRVAIKVSHQGVFHREAQERMHQERQILAGLDHPNICKLLDGGTTEQGMPYFVMEYVEGEPIDTFCERHGLSVEARLQLFRQVCDAVHYAHRQLVIHRDLKPNNILVTRDGVPKLLDFGIAKLLDTSEGALPVAVTSPLVTRSGMRLLTPAYASPEQLLGRSLSTASDVYSLGVLLYRLLIDALPYRLDDVTFAEMERLVCEQEPALASATASKSADPIIRERARRLHGDLDNILAKALRKEPEARYGSVDQLADDLDRHLSGEMVRARPHTLGYRASKFLRRHRLAVTALILVVLSLTTGLGVAIWQARVASFERQQAEAQRLLAEQAQARAERSKELTIDIFRLSDPSVARGNSLTVREALENAISEIRRDLSQDSLDRADLLEIIGIIYQNLGLYDPADTLLREVLELRSDHEASPLDVAAIQNYLGEVLLKKGHAAEAETRFRSSLKLRRQEGAKLQDVAESWINLGTALFDQQQLDAAEAAYAQGFDLLGSQLSAGQEELIEPLGNLAAIRWSQGEQDEAEALYRQGLEIAQAQLDEDDLKTLGLLANLVTVLHSQKEFQQAKPLAEKVLKIRRRLLEDDHPDVAQSLNILSVLDYELGDLEAAEPLQREAITIKEQKFGVDHRSTLSSLNNLGQLLLARGAYTEAVTLYEDLVQRRRRKHGDDHLRVRRDLGQLAEAQLMAGHLEDASASYRAALAEAADAERDPVRYAAASYGLAASLLRLHRPDEAMAHLEAASSRLESMEPQETWLTLRVHGTTLALALESGDADATQRHWNALRPHLEPLAQGANSVRLPRERLALEHLKALLRGAPLPSNGTSGEAVARLLGSNSGS